MSTSEMERRAVLRRYINISLKLADMVEMMPAKEANDFCLKNFSSGCRVVTAELRQGVAELTNLMSEYQNERDRVEINSEDSDRARAFISEIFGYEYVDELDTGILAALKAKLEPLKLHEELDRLCDEYSERK